MSFSDHATLQLGLACHHRRSVSSLVPLHSVCPTRQHGTITHSTIVKQWNIFSKQKKIKNAYNVLVGHAVAQLVEALTYKPEGRGFDS